MVYIGASDVYVRPDRGPVWLRRDRYAEGQGEPGDLPHYMKPSLIYIISSYVMYVMCTIRCCYIYDVM